MSYLLKNVKNSPIKDKNKLTITSKFGKRRFYNKVSKKYESGFHNGIDISSSETIVTPYPGKVIEIRNSIKGYSKKYSKGNYVTIDHGNNVYTTYYHLKYASVCVKKNEQVSEGQIIGLMGSTGHSTGKHLHFGIKINNKWVNPEEYLLGKNLPNTKTSTNKYYIVKKGDTLTSIAKKYNTTWKSLYQTNKDVIGNNPNLIRVGQKLKIQ